MFKAIKNLGPATLVAAAFVGPGTVTVCAAAGITFGYGLLWALLVSVVMTILLQEMAVRIGIVTQKDLAQLLHDHTKNSILKIGITGLILAAIVVGNAAYEAGNMNGAVLGLQAIFGDEFAGFYPIVVGGTAFSLLFFGNIQQLSRILIGLVLLMSLSFVTTALLTGPSLLQLAKGFFLPKVNSENLFTIIALVGTTVVPYNLFLHASLAKERWKDSSGLAAAKTDTIVAIGLGGLVSMAIVVSAAAIPSTQLNSVIDVASGLEPLYGSAAKYLIGLGLFGAGITSAVTAPLAAAYVANSCFNWNVATSHWKFKAVWMLVMGVGVLSLGSSFKPIAVIQFAQIANGLLLPILVGTLIWVSTSNTILGNHKNSWSQNTAYLLIFVFSLALSIKTFIKLLGW
ncbi:Nramp family divalent metal transporter [Flavobacteriaceae bacterium LSUCC0859]|nr:Nramp family divalent metal transporter [Flavobacteriaceae bacterium LSUCC0859]